MRKILVISSLLLIVCLNFIACKKEKLCAGCIDNNKPPVAVAGPDQVITLPTDSISLDGSASSDPDGAITSYLWKKISGPGSFGIVNSTFSKTTVRDLVVGSYQFELSVTDDKGLSDTDTMQVIVRSGSSTNRSPVAHAGVDTIITLPASTINLDGSGSTDPDNNISSYLWKKISGPLSFNILNANAVQTQVTSLGHGMYQFELKVTDDDGLFSKDTMQVSVNPQPPPPNSSCPPTTRPIINAQLVSIGNLSIARYDMATVSAGNKVFFAGGVAASGKTSRVDIYDITSQTWSTAQLSIPRSEIGAVAAGGKVFFAGGYSTTGATSRVDIFDLTTQTWSVVELSQARAYIEAASVGNKVFFAGGSNGVNNFSLVDIYDMATSTWSTANLSEAKIGFTATAAGDKIYFAGGDISNNGPTSNKIDIYDNAIGSWSTSTLNSPKAFHAAIFKSGKIYWSGGATYINYQGGIGNEDLLTCQVEIKDVNTQVSSFANLAYPKYVNGAFEKDNKIAIISFYSGWQYWPDFDVYDVSSNTWSVGVLPQSLSSYASVISVNNVIYVAGGLSSSAGNLEYLTQVWKLEF